MRYTYIFLTVISSLLCLSTLAQTKKPFIRFEENGKYGLVDTSGKVIVAGFDYLEKEYQGFIRARRIDTIYILDDNFNVSFKGTYSDIKAGASKKQFIVEKNGKYGVVDARNKVIIPFEYYFIIKVSPGYYKVRKDNLEGILNTKGKVVIPIIYKDIVAKNAALLVKNDYGKKLIDINNNILVDSFDYDYVKGATSNYMIARKKKEWFLLNNKGSIIAGPFEDIVDYNYDSEQLNRGFIFAIDKGKYWIFNSKTLMNIGIYDSFIGHDVDFPAVKVGDQYGFIDLEGKMFIEPTYDFSLGFNEGLAPVLKDGKWGVINKKNELVIPYQFVGSIGAFNNGIAQYRKGPYSAPSQSWLNDGLINFKGEVILEPIYDDAEYIGGNKAIVVIDGDKYLYDFVKKEKIRALERQTYIMQEPSPSGTLPSLRK